MSKNLICVLSKQLLPNYLFVKEFARPGDTVYFLTTNASDEPKNILWEALKKIKLDIKQQVIPLYGLEEKWASMQNRFKERLPKDEEYLINLTGGTKYISQAVYEYFRDCSAAKVIYIPFPKNEYVDYHTDEPILIKSRISLTEYFDLCGLAYNIDNKIMFPVASKYSYGLFNKFINFSNEERNWISDIRQVHNNKTSWDVLSNDKKFEEFLQKIEFPISKKELDEMGKEKRGKYLKYLAGTWFEEYVRLRLGEALQVQCVGLDHVQNAAAIKDNELDCVAVINNHCLIGECKTVLVWNKEEKFVEETLDKANKINKNIIEALSAKSYLFYLDKKGNEQEIEKSLKQAEKNRLLTPFGQEYFTDNAKFAEMITIIKKDLGYPNVD